MIRCRNRPLFVPICVAAVLLVDGAAAQVPDTIAVPGETVVATFHAEGAQIYDCKADASGKLAWQFREPIATLLRDGATVGRHYAGPIPARRSPMYQARRQAIFPGSNSM